MLVPSRWVVAIRAERGRRPLIGWLVDKTNLFS
ncbi:MAG: hypothetical protein QOD34_3453, partial [Mycobacterium sp.]|nr:hypothetical protein [Mycobacterium sp.]